MPLGQKISEKVDVVLYKTYPTALLWRGRIYKITKIGLHHTYDRGKTFYHVFSVATQGAFLRLLFNTENLSWKLEEIITND